MEGRASHTHTPYLALTTTTTGKGKHVRLTNDELFYDPDMDDADQDWVDKQRAKNYPTQKDKGMRLSLCISPPAHVPSR